MKKLKFLQKIALTAVSCLLLQNIAFPAKAEEELYYGDLDGDGILTVYDLCLMKRGILDSSHLTDLQVQLADLNGDSQLDVQDIKLMLDYLHTRVTGFPVGAVFSAETKNIYNDGTYTATAYGYDGEVTVTIVLENDVITSIQATSEESDEWYFEQARDKVISRILNAQDYNVDAVSGATYSSQAIMSAVKKALNSAKI